MKHWHHYKKFIAATLAFLLIGQILLFTGAAQVNAAAQPVDLKLEAKSAILMDAESGEVLYELNADTPLPPASMAKMMTEYLALEGIKSGKFKLDDIVTTSKSASMVGGSGQLLAAGDKLPLKDMFAAMSIYSANDAAVAIGEFIGGGSEENFAKMMNDKAKEIGMSSSAHFINATGLGRNDVPKEFQPTTIEGETVFSARDSAILAQRLLKDHKEVLDYTKIPSQKLRPNDKKPMINWNWMLEGNKDNVNFKKFAYVGLDGLKTGHTNEAGYCFTGTAVRNGMRLISVVMGTGMDPKLTETQKEGRRFIETQKLLDYGFNNFEKKQVIAEKTTIDTLKTVKISKGIQTEVPLETQSALSLVVRKDMKPEDITKSATAVDATKLVAPIKQGDVLGTLTVTYNKKPHEIKMVATQEVKKASWIRLFFRGIGNFFSGLMNNIKKLFGGK